METLEGTSGVEESREASRAAESVVQYVFPVEVEVRTVGAEIDRDALVEAVLASLHEELSAL